MQYRNTFQINLDSHEKRYVLIADDRTFPGRPPQAYETAISFNEAGFLGIACDGTDQPLSQSLEDTTLDIYREGYIIDWQKSTDNGTIG